MLNFIVFDWIYAYTKFGIVIMLLFLVTDFIPKIPKIKLAYVTWDKSYKDGNYITIESLGKIGLEGSIENEYIDSFCTYKF